jgi:hypothetical protein
MSWAFFAATAEAAQDESFIRVSFRRARFLLAATTRTRASISFCPRRSGAQMLFDPPIAF